MEKQLNLMVIDEDQLYAERLVELLSYYYNDVNLGFLDDKEEFIKLLRSEWDVIVFSRAYDLSFTDVVGILQEHNTFTPIIQLAKNNEDDLLNEVGLPETIDGDMIKTLNLSQEKEMVLAVCLFAAYSQSKRQINKLNSILKEAEQRANILIANSKSAVAYIDQGVHIFANDPYLEMFGYDSMEEIIGVPVVDMIVGNDNIKAFKQFLRRFDKGDRSQVEFEFESRRTDGTTFTSKLQLAASTFEGEPVAQAIIQHNDANSAEIAKQLAEATRKDTLTGLPNRLAFMEELTTVQQEASHGKTRAALIYVSIDSIGKINSSAGLLGVDTTIKEIANLSNEVFEEGFVARFGDAAFTIVLSDINKQTVMDLAESLRSHCQNMLIEVGMRTVTTTLSVAVVMMDNSVPKADVVMSRAFDTIGDINNDTDGVGNRVRAFDISEHASENEDALAEYIKKALSQNSFVLKYQPIYDITDDSSDMSEVFITLPTADGNEMTYDKFAPIAKKHNLLDKIDRWVLINAAKQLSITKKSHPKANLLISLSLASLQDGNLPKMVLQLVKAIGVEGKYPLSLQFHEQDLVDYLAVAKRQFMALSDLKCPVGIQNFGITAKSGDILEYLTPNTARLARSYSKDLDKAASKEAVQSLVANATEVGVDVMMPYIGDAGMMSMAWSIGTRYLQGDYLQAPSQELAYTEQAAEE